jgi:hypothetical protein
MTLNNNPTIEELVEHHAGLGFPGSSSGVAPTPAAGALIQDLRADCRRPRWVCNVNERFLRSRSRSIARHSSVLPRRASERETPSPAWRLYWRFAWQLWLGSNSIEIGTYGLQASHLSERGERQQGRVTPTSPPISSTKRTFGTAC